jgi:SAM-dependent methyltransferase
MPGTSSTPNNDPEFFDRDEFRANLLKYTRKAFQVLPPIERPRILDIGCGTGVCTLELIRLSGGSVVAVDIDKKALDKLVRVAENEGLSNRVTPIQGSMLDMDFAPGSFDIIWSEGAIANMGFERGLRLWRQFLVDGGYLVVHDELSNVEKKVESVREAGFDVRSRFELPPSVWWCEYYAPLKRHLDMMRSTGPLSEKVAAAAEAAEREIAEFNPHSDRYGSFFIIMQKV